MIGDHAQRLVGEVLGVRQRGSDLDQVLEQVDLVVRMHVLQHRRETLQAHAGVDARRRQRRQRAVGRAVELHEHQVPDFDVAVAVFVRRTRRTTGDVFAVVVEDFRARTAGAGVGHLPEIVRCERRALVVADAHDALGGHADFLVPQVEGFVIGVIDGDPQLVLGQLEHARQQLPGTRDRVALEVVAERPVAQHFEEGVVARGVAHRIQVVVLAAGTQAALHVGRAHVRQLLAAQEHVLELHHARIGEQQRGIAGRHQGTRRHDGVAFRAEDIRGRSSGFRRFSCGWGGPGGWVTPGSTAETTATRPAREVKLRRRLRRPRRRG